MSRSTNLDATGEKTTAKACAAVFDAKPAALAKVADTLAAAIDGLPYSTKGPEMLAGAFFPQNTRKPNRRRGFGETSVVVESLRIFGGEVEKISITAEVQRGGHDGSAFVAQVVAHAWISGDPKPKNLTAKGPAVVAACGCARKFRGMIAVDARRITPETWRRAILGALANAQAGAEYLRETSRPDEHAASGRDRLGRRK